MKLRDRIFATAGMEALPRSCRDLLVSQQASWPELGQAYESLTRVRMRDLQCEGFLVHIQHNPGRATSSMARVDAANLRERRCFLCPDNLPHLQKGILYREEYLILCNPMPILHSHLTIAHLEHRPQAMDRNIPTLLQLMTDLGKRWLVLYNGPRCGASAPDHLHFQAIPAWRTPIEHEIEDEKRLVLISDQKGISVSRVRGLGREVFVVEGSDQAAVTHAIRDLLLRAKGDRGVGGDRLYLEEKGDIEEPMVNIAGSFEEGVWRVIIFPRRKHRPCCFFAEGEGRILISPAVIEMAGVIVTPLARDFERLGALTVEGIYREVTSFQYPLCRTLP